MSCFGCYAVNFQSYQSKFHQNYQLGITLDEDDILQPPVSEAEQLDFMDMLPALDEFNEAWSTGQTADLLF